MAKDYAKFVPSKPSKQPARRSRLPLIIFLLIVLSGATTLSVYAYEKKLPDSAVARSKLNALVETVAAVLSHKKASGGPVLLKEGVAKAEQPPAVQFDFYNQLPNMQISKPETIALSAAPVQQETASGIKNTGPVAAQPAPQSTPIIVDPVPKVVKVVQPPPVAVPAVAASPAPAVPAKTVSKAVIQADEISSLLASENEISQYVLQLDAFESEEAAKRLVSALTDVGFSTKVVRLNKNGHIQYIVQQGPFANKALATSAQRRLQKRGIESVIHKMA